MCSFIHILFNYILSSHARIGMHSGHLEAHAVSVFPSVHTSVHSSVHSSVRPSFRPSVRQDIQKLMPGTPITHACATASADALFRFAFVSKNYLESKNCRTEFEIIGRYQYVGTST